jgi:hypothetical protein
MSVIEHANLVTGTGFKTETNWVFIHHYPTIQSKNDPLNNHSRGKLFYIWILSNRNRFSKASKRRQFKLIF